MNNVRHLHTARTEPVNLPKRHPECRECVPADVGCAAECWQPAVEPICWCGHLESAHDAGECWTAPDNHDHPTPKCECSRYEPRSGGMSDLDARIRNWFMDNDRDDDESARNLAKTCDALSAALDALNDVEPYEHPDADKVRLTIARKLGVSE